MVLCRLKHVGENNFNYNFNWGYVFFKVFYVKYFRKDIKKVQVVGSLYKYRLLHGKMKNIIIWTFTTISLCVPVYVKQVLYLKTHVLYIYDISQRRGIALQSSVIDCSSRRERDKFKFDKRRIS